MADQVDLFHQLDTHPFGLIASIVAEAT
jgi:hypothetical protein